MHVARIGFTAVKGGRHLEHGHVDLASTGPVGDRVFCLVDPRRRRVLRTVENPALVQGVARWQAGVLSVSLPTGTAEGVPVRTGEVLEVDYWGRAARVEVVHGPWAEAFSRHVGYDVLLARSSAPGEVVYGAPVTVVTTGALRLLADRVGREVAGERFRATLLVDTGDAAPDVEDTWIGRELAVGRARVLVGARVPRCAVVDLDPATGGDRLPVMRALAGYRRGHGEVTFGVDAVVTGPGRVHIGDEVELAAGLR